MNLNNDNIWSEQFKKILKEKSVNPENLFIFPEKEKQASELIICKPIFAYVSKQPCKFKTSKNFEEYCAIFPDVAPQIKDFLDQQKLVSVSFGSKLISYNGVNLEKQVYTLCNLLYIIIDKDNYYPLPPYDLITENEKEVIEFVKNVQESLDSDHEEFTYVPDKTEKLEDGTIKLTDYMDRFYTICRYAQTQWMI